MPGARAAARAHTRGGSGLVASAIDFTGPPQQAHGSTTWCAAGAPCGCWPSLRFSRHRARRQGGWLATGPAVDRAACGSDPQQGHGCGGGGGSSIACEHVRPRGRGSGSGGPGGLGVGSGARARNERRGADGDTDTAERQWVRGGRLREKRLLRHPDGRHPAGALHSGIRYGQRPPYPPKHLLQERNLPCPQALPPHGLQHGCRYRL
mmetsp:Transcript_121831/g.260041  ORF Transcript_121831/g.260041 Transcript_121831/m.260041 type:complete len:207 (+) Transcript_121831:265-885(+)